MNDLSPSVHPFAWLGRRWSGIALLLILGVAGLLRFGWLDSIPPGLWFDEALNGQDALAVWAPGGGFKLVYPAEFPREPLYETMLAFVVRAAGPRVVPMRALSATLGILTVLLVFLALRRTAGRGPALAAAAILATMRWHVLFSRLVLRTLILGPWMMGIVWAALAYRRRPTALKAILFGALVGGGFYTYLAWYFLLPAVAGLALWLAWSERHSRAGRRRIALGAICAALTFAPLGIHYLRVPADLLARPAAVSIFAQGLGPGIREIAKNIAETLLMFHWRGDHVPIQNIPHRPALEPIQGILFLYGLILCGVGVRRNRRLPGALLAWLGCGLAATVLTHTDSPNFLRTLCVTPAVAAIAGLGLAHLFRFLDRRPGPTARKLLVASALVLYWSASCAGDLMAWGSRIDVRERFHGPLVQIASAVRQAPSLRACFVPRSWWEPRPFQFLTADLSNVYPYEGVDALAPWPPPSVPANRPRPLVRRLIIVDPRVLNWIRSRGLGGETYEKLNDPTGRPWGIVYDLPETALDIFSKSGDKQQLTPAKADSH